MSTKQSSFLEEMPYHIRRSVAHTLIRNYCCYCLAYYKYGVSLISDAEFDAICRIREFEWLKPFDLNGYIDKDMLDCGSGYHIPSILKGLTLQYCEDAIAMRSFRNDQ